MQMNMPPMNHSNIVNTAGPMIGPSPNLPPMGPYGFMPIIRKPDFP